MLDYVSIIREIGEKRKGREGKGREGKEREGKGREGKGATNHYTPVIKISALHLPLRGFCLGG